MSWVLVQVRTVSPVQSSPIERATSCLTYNNWGSRHDYDFNASVFASLDDPYLIDMFSL